MMDGSELPYLSDIGERSAPPMSRVVGNQNSHQNSPGELERVAALSNFNQKDFPQGNR